MILCLKHCWMSWFPCHCSSKYGLCSICNDPYLDAQCHSRWLGLPKIAEAWCWNLLSDHLSVWLSIHWRIFFVTIVTLKATILHFIAKVLTQVKVSVWHILALGLTWLFSLFSNLWHICSVCGWISASLNVDVSVHRTFSYTAAGHVCSNLVFGTGRIVLGNRNPDFLQFIPSPQTRLNRCDAQKGAMQSSFSHHFHYYLPGKERSRV